MSLATYAENALINALLRATNYTAPTTVYVALHTGAPGAAGSANEVSTSGTAYARTAGAFGAPSSGVSTNSSDIQFPTATGSGWGTINYFSIWDASSAGNCLFVSDVLATPKAVGAGDSAKFASGVLQASLV